MEIKHNTGEFLERCHAILTREKKGYRNKMIVKPCKDIFLGIKSFFFLLIP